MVIPHVNHAHGEIEGIGEFRIAVAEIERPTVDVNVDQPLPGGVVEVVALPSVDDQLRSLRPPEPNLVRVPDRGCLLKKVLLGSEAEVIEARWNGIGQTAILGVMVDHCQAVNRDRWAICPGAIATAVQWLGSSSPGLARRWAAASTAGVLGTPPQSGSFF
jgi:hypothetical protein